MGILVILLMVASCEVQYITLRYRNLIKRISNQFFLDYASSHVVLNVKVQLHWSFNCLIIDYPLLIYYFTEHFNDVMVYLLYYWFCFNARCYLADFYWLMYITRILAYLIYVGSLHLFCPLISFFHLQRHFFNLIDCC